MKQSGLWREPAWQVGELMHIEIHNSWQVLAQIHYQSGINNATPKILVWTVWNHWNPLEIDQFVAPGQWRNLGFAWSHQGDLAEIVRDRQRLAGLR
jgi:hypothetical protein